ncbi:hypothetical protein H0H92_001253 [Tricholoma furcatifolium]|nr:hypothetical protein H0H92_001253 [Tricholoma furcatifolium]
MAEFKTPESSRSTTIPSEETNEMRSSNESTPESLTPPDRSELLSRARGFLQSPQINHQDAVAKRQFLLEKGLNEVEVDTLLRELPTQPPAIPPRTYPHPPPPHLPTLLLGLARIFSWIAGGSAALIFIYYTALARRTLRTHHLSLLGRLNESLASLKQANRELYSTLPSADPSGESPTFQACHTIPDILRSLGKDPDMATIPTITLLRCALENFGKGKEGDISKPTTEDLFLYLEGQIPWLVTEEGQKYEQKLWETLSTSSMFTGSSPTASEGDVSIVKITRWEYQPPAPAEPSLVAKSMKRLVTSLPKKSEVKSTSRQHTLQGLSDLTGYITTQMYMPYQAPSSAAGFLNGNTSASPAEEEFKREIRSLKGLVLNR